ncbi:tyrosine-protein phosphatase [Vagococcus silagei]|uniref:Tyrosine-protein phosphatase n=1 Tax=Vagococcus silagei TaxID=2508885 RepID=A0A4S3B439_9ENTE|nr:CpsB/CapC family capsule biosynthesis tyrosine phosphatase [Vagococcus silagei]THB60166.1 tyrosine protein phosphatase [Vagococcus silagei]
MSIDIHCHILPGIDDGAQNLEASLLMAEAAVEEGITHILCTPHHNNGVYLNPREHVIKHVAALQEELDKRKIPLTLFEGQEIRLSTDITYRVETQDILFADLTDTYLLIEFPSSNIPAYAEQVLFELCANGYRPIIVHPERNAQIMKEPNDLVPFIEMGCLAQLTNASLLGLFGREIEKTSHTLIKHNLVHLIASDAHVHEGRRAFHMQEAYAKLEKEYGENRRKLFEKTALNIISGEKVDTLQPEMIELKWYQRLGLFKK